LKEEHKIGWLICTKNEIQSHISTVGNIVEGEEPRAFYAAFYAIGVIARLRSSPDRVPISSPRS